MESVASAGTVASESHLLGPREANNVSQNNKPNNGAALVHERAQNRAEYLYASYLSLGRGRSLGKLHTVLTGLGLKIALSTLKNYCAKGNWLNRASAADADVNADVMMVEESNALAVHIAELNHRHAQAGQALQEISIAGLHALDPHEFTATEVTNMLEKGIKLERLAEGQATSRHELTVQIVEPLVRQIITLLEQVNLVGDAEARSRQFAIGADAIIVDNFSEVVE